MSMNIIRRRDYDNCLDRTRQALSDKYYVEHDDAFIELKLDFASRAEFEKAVNSGYFDEADSVLRALLQNEQK
ncbi:hypothetical protein ACMXYR_02775 [Neptuniibacter sp. QD29_5]|uniref:hypothetical protein n=1 Tax=Neptuniibacter sp. QD29_5 TaxID=3398207 RepID=UPI0039F64231